MADARDFGSRDEIGFPEKRTHARRSKSDGRNKRRCNAENERQIYALRAEFDKIFLCEIVDLQFYFRRR